MSSHKANTAAHWTLRKVNYLSLLVSRRNWPRNFVFSFLVIRSKTDRNRNGRFNFHFLFTALTIRYMESHNRGQTNSLQSRIGFWMWDVLYDTANLRQMLPVAHGNHTYITFGYGCYRKKKKLLGIYFRHRSNTILSFDWVHKIYIHKYMCRPFLPWDASTIYIVALKHYYCVRWRLLRTGTIMGRTFSLARQIFSIDGGCSTEELANTAYFYHKKCPLRTEAIEWLIG